MSTSACLTLVDYWQGKILFCHCFYIWSNFFINISIIYLFIYYTIYNVQTAVLIFIVTFTIFRPLYTPALFMCYILLFRIEPFMVVVTSLFRMCLVGAHTRVFFLPLPIWHYLAISVVNINLLLVRSSWHNIVKSFIMFSPDPAFQVISILDYDSVEVWLQGFDSVLQ